MITVQATKNTGLLTKTAHVVVKVKEIPDETYKNSDALADYVADKVSEVRHDFESQDSIDFAPEFAIQIIG